MARKTLREFTSDQCTDLAAALTYYGTLAIFPALLAFVALLGLFGDPQSTTESILQLASSVVPADSLDLVRGPIKELTQSPAAGLAFVTGLAGAVWSASGFVGAFARAMNRIYSIQEGRPFIKLRTTTLLVTVITLIAAVLAAAMIVLSGPVAEQVGSLVGLGETAVVVWSFVKWPILGVIAILMIALLYYATPNIRQPKFKWMSVGALVALVLWVLASIAFGLYVANFSSYGATYGSIGGVIVFLLWLWISNIALLFGAELDAELERGRQLQAGIKAEETLQLPPRDTKISDKKADKHAEDVRIGRELRKQSVQNGDPEKDEERGNPDAGMRQGSGSAGKR